MSGTSATSSVARAQIGGELDRIDFGDLRGDEAGQRLGVEVGDRADADVERGFIAGMSPIWMTAVLTLGFLAARFFTGLFHGGRRSRRICAD